MTIKTAREIALMNEAGKVVEGALALIGSMIRPGVTTKELDRAADKFIRSKGGVPSFKGYRGYPANVCISLNEVIVHGIPDKRVLREGDIVGVDIGVFLNGYNGDAARTFPVGKISDEDERLIRVTRECFFEGLKKARPGYRVSDISNAVQLHAEANGFSVVRMLVGHGIGRKMHELPDVPNFGAPGHGNRLLKGMTICIEPMINAGTFDAKILEDGWTTVTMDSKNSAHYENTVCITDGDPVLLTLNEPWEYTGADGVRICGGYDLPGSVKPSAKSGETLGIKSGEMRGAKVSEVLGASGIEVFGH